MEKEMQKQIKEMARDLCKHSLTEYCASGRCSNPNCLVNAKALEILCEKGYRKASEVARNIFGNLRILAHIDFDGNICIRKDSFDELEKNYTEEKE